MMEIYTNCDALVGDELELVRDVTIAVDRGKIAGIEEGRRDAGVDLAGGLVMPAFINAHTHIGDTAAKELGIGLPVEAAVKPPDGLKHRLLQAMSREELHRSIRQGLKEMMRSGVAAFGDFREGGLDGVRVLREASRDLPIRPVILGRPMADSKSGFKVTQRELEIIAAEADGFGISSIDAFTPVVFRAIRKIAGDKVFAIHISESPREAAMSVEKYGATEVRRAFEFEPDLMVHLTHATDEDIEELKIRRQPIVCCPRTNLLLGDGIPPLHKFYESGIPVAFGSDNMMFSSPDMFREMDMASRATRGATREPSSITAEYALRAATISGAKALKLDAELGSLKPGKAATFLVLDRGKDWCAFSRNELSSIVHRAGPADIRWYVYAGEPVIEDGVFLYENI
jgi:cytosine/adenosine deaminase-related metal-dependent hydrolase